MSSALLRALMVACVGLTPALGLAASRTSSLSWMRLEGAESCIATQALARAVEERLHRAVFVSASQAEVSVEGRIERIKGGKGWQAVLNIRDARGKLLGTRKLETPGPACSKIDESLALVVAVMIDPDAALAPPAPKESPPPSEPQVIVQHETVYVPVVVPAPVAEAQAPAAPPERWRVEAGAGATATFGALPGVGWGPAAGGVLTPPGFLGVRVAGAVRWGAKDLGDGARVEQRLASGTLGLCPLRAAGAEWLRWEACANLLLGSLHSAGVGFDVERQASAFFAEAQTEGRFAVRVVGPVWTELGLAAGLPLTRAAVVYTMPDGQNREGFRTSAVALTTELGLSLALP